MGGYSDQLMAYLLPMLIGVFSGLVIYGWLGTLFGRKTPLARRYLLLAVVSGCLALLTLLLRLLIR